MADLQQAEPLPPEPTPSEKSRTGRDATFKARAAKAAKRFADVHANTEEPKPESPAPKPAETPAPVVAAEPVPEKKPDSAKVNKRHAIAERRERRVKVREEKIHDRERKASLAEHNLQTRYGDPDAAKQAYDKGSFHEAAKYMQRIFGDDFATITQKIARATAGLSPEKLKELEDRDAFTREKREFDARKAKDKEESEKGATREKAQKVVTEKCAGHDALKLRNGAELVLRELEANFDATAKTFKISFRQAADKVVAEKLAEAEALGVRRPSAKIVESAPPPVARLAKKVIHPEPSPKNGSRLSFEERHAAAGRIYAKRRQQ